MKITLAPENKTDAESAKKYAPCCMATIVPSKSLEWQEGGRSSFVYRFRAAQNLILEKSKKHGIKILDQAINYNHIHLAITIPSHESYKSWIRELSGALAILLGEGKALFTARPYTRLLGWGRELQILRRYFDLNFLEALGFPRKRGRAILALARAAPD